MSRSVSTPAATPELWLWLRLWGGVTLQSADQTQQLHN